MMKLIDVCEIQYGYAFDSAQFSTTEGVPLIRIRDVVRGYSDTFTSESCSECYHVENDDILIGMDGEFNIAYWKGGHAYLNQRVCKMSPKPDVNKDYLFYQMIPILKAIENRTPYVTVKHLSAKELNRVELQLPDFLTQRRIAATLDKVSEGIALCKQMLADLDELVKSQFVELFGDPAKNSMGWPMKALGECLDSIGNGKSFVCESHSREGEFPAVLKLSAATTGTYQPDENKAVMDEDDFVDSAEVHDGDLLFTRKNTPELVGMAAYVFKTPPKLMMPDIVFRLNTDEKHCKKIYLWQLINHTMFRPCIQALANGSAKSMSNISKEKLMKLFIPVPDMDIQERFIDFFMQADKSKFAVQQQLMELETLKESLMQEYFG